VKEEDKRQFYAACASRGFRHLLKPAIAPGAFITEGPAFLLLMLLVSLVVTFAAHALYPSTVQALPTGYSTQHGDVTFTQPNTSTLNVSTTTHRAIVNYQQFNLNQGETVNFNLPSANSAILNRVTGGDPSLIMGAINSNGHVFLINPSGILFGATAQVNVGGLVASTLDLSNDDFLSQTYNFYKVPGSLSASVQNQGLIQTASGGTLLLVGQAVENTGTMAAPKGQIYVAVGDRVKVDVDENNRITGLTVEAPVGEPVAGMSQPIINLGTMDAEGGTVRLQVSTQDDVYALATNLQGIVRASQLVLSDGELELTAFSPDGDGNLITKLQTTLSTMEDTDESPPDPTESPHAEPFFQPPEEVGNHDPPDTGPSDSFNTNSTSTLDSVTLSGIGAFMTDTSWSTTLTRDQKLDLTQTYTKLWSLPLFTAYSPPGSIAGAAAPIGEDDEAEYNSLNDDWSFYILLYETPQGRMEMKPFRPQP
jgi:filamentous hemagglutinin family protein